MIRAPAAALLLLLLGTNARAFSLEEDAQIWTPLFINAPARGRLVGLLELQPRVRGEFGRLTTAIVRPWIGWRVGPATFLHAGYGWIRSDTTRVTVEHRARNTASTTNPISAAPMRNITSIYLRPPTLSCWMMKLSIAMGYGSLGSQMARMLPRWSGDNTVRIGLNSLFFKYFISLILFY